MKPTWTASFILTFTFPLLTQRLETAGTFWLYAGICLAGLIFIRLRIPETKGKTLEQIEQELIGRGDPTPRLSQRRDRHASRS